MARYVAIFLLVAFAMQTFQQTLILLDYQLNLGAFVKKCVNKARPQMMCKGNCQMLKKLQAEEKEKEQMPERKLENKTEVGFAYHFYNISLNAEFYSYSALFPKFKEGKVTDCSFTIFHPPALL